MKRIVSIIALVVAAIGPTAWSHVQAEPGPTIDLRPPADPNPTPDPGPAPEVGSATVAKPPSTGGDAESAPSVPPPPLTIPDPHRDDRIQPRRRVALLPRFAYRLGEAGRAVSPAAGYGLAGTIELTYVRAPANLEAAMGIDFGYDRFATAEQGMVLVEGVERAFGSTRVVSETSFVLLHTAAVTVGPARPYLTLGGGLGLGYFDSAARDLRPGTASDTHLLGRVALGVDVSLGRAYCLAVRADYTAVRGVGPFATSDGRQLALFGDLFALAVGVGFRF